MDVLMLVVVLIVVLLLGAGLAVAAISRKQKQANEVVPGVPTSAPASWAGAHSPEARLHRRLRDAVVGLRAQTGIADAAAEVSALETAALELDDQLVAVAALPARVREAPLAQIAAAITALEDTAEALALRGATEGTYGERSGNGRGRVDEVAERLRLLDAARAELDAAVPDLTRPGAAGQVEPAAEPPEQPREEPGTAR